MHHYSKLITHGHFLLTYISVLKAWLIFINQDKTNNILKLNECIQNTNAVCNPRQIQSEIQSSPRQIQSETKFSLRQFQSEKKFSVRQIQSETKFRPKKKIPTVRKKFSD